MDPLGYGLHGYDETVVVCGGCLYYDGHNGVAAVNGRDNRLTYYNFPPSRPSGCLLSMGRCNH